MSDRLPWGAKVAGYCPMGCGRTLFLGTGGHVTCSYLPLPLAASTICCTTQRGGPRP